MVKKDKTSKKIISSIPLSVKQCCPQPMKHQTVPNSPYNMIQVSPQHETRKKVSTSMTKRTFPTSAGYDAGGRAHATGRHSRAHRGPSRFEFRTLQTSTSTPFLILNFNSYFCASVFGTLRILCQYFVFLSQQVSFMLRYFTCVGVFDR